MKMNKVVRISWNGIAKNKLRSFLTTLGIIIGVAAVIVMISVSAGTEAAIEDEIENMLQLNGGFVFEVRANARRK